MKKKLKLRRWVLVVIHLILVIVIVYAIVSLFTTKTTVITEGKNYTCNGSWVFQVCSGTTYE